MRTSGITAPVLWATLFAMTLFAGNSVLNRMALLEEHMPALPYACLRMCAGAAVLWAVALRRNRRAPLGGSWPSALALTAYMLLFSRAYLELPAAVGTLIIAVAVPGVMVAWGLMRGERFTFRLGFGLLVSLMGLIFLLMPGLSAPPLFSSGLMFISGAAWGVYSILGKHSADPVRDTAGNFLRGAPLALAVQICALVLAPSSRAELAAGLTPAGVALALSAGAFMSAVGYVVWYAVMPCYTYAGAAVVQLSVPLITAAGALLWLGETVDLRIAVSSAAILGGIAIVVRARGNTRARAAA